MRIRNALCEKGFSFEYSATFGQAVKVKPKLTELYARSTLFDYSYRHFYFDGFGKDYQILLWLLAGGKQHVIFVDPKGIRNLGPTDPKIQFHETIKEIEQRLGDPAVRLQSFKVFSS